MCFIAAAQGSDVAAAAAAALAAVSVAFEEADLSYSILAAQHAQQLYRCRLRCALFKCIYRTPIVCVSACCHPHCRGPCRAGPEQKMVPGMPFTGWNASERCICIGQCACQGGHAAHLYFHPDWKGCSISPDKYGVRSHHSFATKYRGLSWRSLPPAVTGSPYTASGDVDGLAWAAAWLYRQSGSTNPSYLADAEPFFSEYQQASAQSRDSLSRGTPCSEGPLS